MLIELERRGHLPEAAPSKRDRTGRAAPAEDAPSRYAYRRGKRIDLAFMVPHPSRTEVEVRTRGTCSRVEMSKLDILGRALRVIARA